jgi:hypothetical protein
MAVLRLFNGGDVRGGHTAAVAEQLPQFRAVKTPLNSLLRGRPTSKAYSTPSTHPSHMLNVL